MIDQLPWEKDLPFAPLRVVWILASIFLLPSIFTALSFPETSAMLASSLLALPVCFGKKEELGFKNSTKEEMIQTYRTIYSIENEKKYGVIVFKVKVI